MTQLTPIALLGPLITGYTSHQYRAHERLLVVSILCLMSLVTVWVNSAMNHLADKKRRCSGVMMIVMLIINMVAVGKILKSLLCSRIQKKL